MFRTVWQLFSWIPETTRNLGLLLLRHFGTTSPSLDSLLPQGKRSSERVESGQHWAGVEQEEFFTWHHVFSYTLEVWKLETNGRRYSYSLAASWRGRRAHTLSYSLCSWVFFMGMKGREPREIWRVCLEQSDAPSLQYLHQQLQGKSLVMSQSSSLNKLHR